MAKKSEEKKEVKTTESDQIWEQIKGLKLELFALPGQTLEKHASRLTVTDDAVHMQLKSQAVLVALEEALKEVPLPKNKEWELSQTTRYTVLKRVVKQ